MQLILFTRVQYLPWTIDQTLAVLWGGEWATGHGITGYRLISLFISPTVRHPVQLSVYA